MLCPSCQWCGGREGSVSGGSSPEKGHYQACVVFCCQGGLPVSRAERPVRLQDKWMTYVLQSRTQWACYFASASNETTLYYCRRQRINKHNIWGWVLRSVFSLSSSLLSAVMAPLGPLVLKLGGFSCYSQTSRCKQALDEPPQGYLDIHGLSGLQKTLVPSLHAAGRHGEWVMGQASLEMRKKGGLACYPSQTGCVRDHKDGQVPRFQQRQE